MAQWSWGWINAEEMPALPPGTRVGLFGAGWGAVDCMHWMRSVDAGWTPVAIADNDPSKQSKTFAGLEVLPPAALVDRAEVVLVATVSGREAVSAQLEAMGLAPGKDFFCVGRFPPAHGLRNVEMLLELDRKLTFLPTPANGAGGCALNVGPGGLLGVERALYALGYERVTAVDALHFGRCYPDITDAAGDYDAFAEELCALAARYGRDPGLVRERWDDAAERRSGRVVLDVERIRLEAPHRFSCLPVADGSRDLVTSFGVLEHVRLPGRAVSECARALRPGAVTVHHVITRDHRSFDPENVFSPIEYRFCSEEEWERNTAERFYQNRVAPHEWRRLFEGAGLRELFYAVESREPMTPAVRARVDEAFADWPDEDLGAVNCAAAFGKPGP